MRQKSAQSNASVERAVGDIRRKARRRHSMEKRIRIILEDFRGEDAEKAALWMRSAISGFITCASNTPRP